MLSQNKSGQAPVMTPQSFPRRSQALSTSLALPNPGRASRDRYYACTKLIRTARHVFRCCSCAWTPLRSAQTGDDCLATSTAGSEKDPLLLDAHSHTPAFESLVMTFNEHRGLIPAASVLPGLVKFYISKVASLGYTPVPSAYGPVVVRPYFP